MATQAELIAAAEGSAAPGSRRLERGLLITFEGGEGTGKTTQVERLAGKLQSCGFIVHTAREPGGTQLGEYVRTWIKRETGTSALAETLLFSAARAELVSALIRPKLKNGEVVVLDRFTDSTLAYQGYGRGMSLKKIAELNEIATGGLTPDLTVFLDLDPEKALQRVDTRPSLFDNAGPETSQKRVDPENERRFERASLAFHRKVLNGYRKLAAEKGRWCVVRADQAQHRVADAIWKRVARLFADQGFDLSESPRYSAK